jgi:hypothetical protein
VAVGLGSVLYWHRTEQQGHGDLRPYLLVQFYPILAIPLLLLLFPPRYGQAGLIRAASEVKTRHSVGERGASAPCFVQQQGSDVLSSNRGLMFCPATGV